MGELCCEKIKKTHVVSEDEATFVTYIRDFKIFDMKTAPCKVQMAINVEKIGAFVQVAMLARVTVVLETILRSVVPKLCYAYH